MAATVTVVYRVIAAVAYRDRPLVRIMAEEVPAAELRYVVPFEARSRYVGADYVEQLAEVKGGTFRRNPPDVGILASLDSLDGPDFDASRVHPLIREFYEHTSRFKLSIVPEWRAWMKPGYELFKRVVAEPLGQAAIPSNIEEAQRGMVSTIDTIDLDDDEVIDIRGWIRTFADSGKPIYVGIYTSFRHEDRGYVSVGFPIPSANFTATLEPRNTGEHDLLLTSRSKLAFPGHYLSSVDSERDALTVLKLLSFQEQIHVYVADGELKTDHSFYLAGQRFLTLRYEIARRQARARRRTSPLISTFAPPLDGEGSRCGARPAPPADCTGARSRTAAGWEAASPPARPVGRGDRSRCAISTTVGHRPAIAKRAAARRRAGPLHQRLGRFQEADLLLHTQSVASPLIPHPKPGSPPPPRTIASSPAALPLATRAGRHVL